MPKMIQFGAAGLAAMFVIGLAAQPSNAQVGGAVLESNAREIAAKIKEYLSHHSCRSPGDEDAIHELGAEAARAQLAILAFNNNKEKSSGNITFSLTSSINRLDFLKPCKPFVVKPPTKPKTLDRPPRGNID